MMRRRVKRARAGGFDLRIPPDERDLLRSVGPQLRDLERREDAALLEDHSSRLSTEVPPCS